jgi:hypothetical protein
MPGRNQDFRRGAPQLSPTQPHWRALRRTARAPPSCFQRCCTQSLLTMMVRLRACDILPPRIIGDKFRSLLPTEHCDFGRLEPGYAGWPARLDLSKWLLESRSFTHRVEISVHLHPKAIQDGSNLSEVGGRGFAWRYSNMNTVDFRRSRSQREVTSLRPHGDES